MCCPLGDRMPPPARVLRVVSWAGHSQNGDGQYSNRCRGRAVWLLSELRQHSVPTPPPRSGQSRPSSSRFRLRSGWLEAEPGACQPRAKRSTCLPIGCQQRPAPQLSTRLPFTPQASQILVQKRLGRRRAPHVRALLGPETIVSSRRAHRAVCCTPTNSGQPTKNSPTNPMPSVSHSCQVCASGFGPDATCPSGTLDARKAPAQSKRQRNTRNARNRKRNFAHPLLVCRR